MLYLNLTHSRIVCFATALAYYGFVEVKILHQLSFDRISSCNMSVAQEVISYLVFEWFNTFDKVQTKLQIFAFSSVRIEQNRRSSLPWMQMIEKMVCSWNCRHQMRFIKPLNLCCNRFRPWWSHTWNARRYWKWATESVECSTASIEWRCKTQKIPLPTNRCAQ